MWLYKCTIYHKIEDFGLIANIYLFGSHFAPGVTFLEMIKKNKSLLKRLGFKSGAQGCYLKVFMDEKLTLT